jgi:hypothetical protein
MPRIPIKSSQPFVARQIESRQGCAMSKQARQPLGDAMRKRRSIAAKGVLHGFSEVDGLQARMPYISLRGDLPAKFEDQRCDHG